MMDLIDDRLFDTPVPTSDRLEENLGNIVAGMPDWDEDDEDFPQEEYGGES